MTEPEGFTGKLDLCRQWENVVISLSSTTESSKLSHFMENCVWWIFWLDEIFGFEGTGNKGKRATTDSAGFRATLYWCICTAWSRVPKKNSQSMVYSVMPRSMRLFFWLSMFLECLLKTALSRSRLLLFSAAGFFFRVVLSSHNCFGLIRQIVNFAINFLLQDIDVCHSKILDWDLK